VRDGAKDGAERQLVPFLLADSTIYSLLSTRRFTPRPARLVDALRLNVRFYMYAGIGGVVIYFLLLLFGGGMNVAHFLMAAGNTYGLLLVVLLLGYGLVSIPRSMLEKAKPENQLERRYLLAPTVDTDLYEAVWDLQDVEECVEKVRGSQGSELPNTALYDKLTLPPRRFVPRPRSSLRSSHLRSSSAVPPPTTLQHSSTSPISSP